ncbi:MAG: TIGR03905 family TSCPD domain-containing protein [Elusimicrobia bacterium]|nr:TIGR03905 family TSCPD domain-containing protein [Elusimicrobiota bacterium]
MKRKLEGVCSKEVNFRVVGGRLKGVKFFKGCPGNLEAMGKLLEGMRVKDAVAKLKGITCGDKGTSCSDQLARTLEKLAKTSE